MKKLLAIFLFLLLVAAIWLGHEIVSFDRNAWLKDYSQLKSEMSRGYANLEWMSQHRKVDLAELDRRTLRLLQSARFDAQAQGALHAFLAEFSDGHLRLQPAAPGWAQRIDDWVDGRKRKPEEPIEFSSSDSADRACSAIGFYAGKRDLELPVDKLPGFSATNSDNPVFAATFQDSKARNWALLRIPLFDERQQGAACAAVWEEHRKTFTGKCDEKCQDAFYYRATDRATADIEAQIRKAASGNVQGLVVDLTGNGGGSDWVEPLLRIVSPNQIPLQKGAVVRHPHHSKNTENLLKDLEAELASSGLRPELRALLEERKKALTAELVALNQPCDVSSWWSGGKVDCSPILVREGRYFSREQLEGLESKYLLFSPAQYRYTEGVWKGPLYIVTDRGTASASELFAVQLRDHGNAILIGERTFGAGCGYINGGIPVTLKHSGIKVRMPDCVRMDKSGRNEVDGIEPQFAIFSKQDDNNTRLQKLIEFLSGRP